MIATHCPFPLVITLSLASAVCTPAQADNPTAAKAEPFVAVSGHGRPTTSLEFDPAGDFRLRMERRNRVFVMTTQPRMPKEKQFAFVEKVTLDDDMNRATIYKFERKGNNEKIWIWCDIEKVAPDNLTEMRVTRAPFCIAQAINAAGIQAIPLERENAPESERIEPLPPVKVRVDDKWGYRDSLTDEIVIAPRFLNASQFGEHGLVDRALVRLEDGWGFIDPTGNLAIPATYDRFGDHFWGNDILAFRGQEAGLVDRDGNEVIEPAYQKVQPFGPGEDSLAAVCLSGQWGFVDRSGKLVIPAQYQKVGWFAEGLGAATAADGRWGFIDRTGKWRIEPTFERATGFLVGYATVQVKDGKWGVINTKGEFLLEPRFDRLRPYRNGRWRAQLDGVNGHVFPDGRFVPR